MVAISRRFGRNVLVMRNEANAVTALFRRAMAGLKSWPEAQTVLHGAYNRMSPAIKYGLGIGSADVVVVAWGRFLAIEFKAGRNGQSEEQAAWEESVGRAGGWYRVVRSVDEAVEAVEACRV